MAAFLANRMRVMIQGVDISHLCRSFSVQGSVGSVVSIQLELVGAVSIDDQGVFCIGDKQPVKSGEAPQVRAISLGGIVS